MENQTLIQAIMSTYQARENCILSENTEWKVRHEKNLKQLYALLPSGSGIDNGTAIESIRADRLVLACGFHHMNDTGYYVGWTEHFITVRPDWTGISIKITGPNQNEIKDHLHDVYYCALTSRVEWTEAGYRFATEAA